MDPELETAEEVVAEPTLDSTSGIDAADLAAPPVADGGSAGDAGAAGAYSPAPADPNVAAAQAPSIRDAAKTWGLDLSQYPDDATAFAHLVQAAQASRQNDYYTSLGRQIAPHYAGVTKYLESQQAAAAPPERDPWVAPEFDDRWLGLVEKDPSTGRYVAKQGVNPAYADKVNEYSEHLDNWTGMLAREPEKALTGLIKKITGTLVQESFGQQRAVQEAQGIVAQNESWIYQVDANGQRLVGAGGKFVPTPMGARYYSHLQTLKSAGVNDARTLDTLAKQMLQSDIYASQAQQAAAPAAAPAPTRAATFARPNVNPGQAVPAPRRQVVPGATEPQTQGLSLTEMLRQEMAAAGVTDEDFRQQFA